MRRISLALALIGAVAAAGCGGAKSGSNTSPDQGVAGQTFTVSVSVWTGGSVKSQTGTLNPDGVTYTFADDGKISCTGAATCSADYAYGKVVQLVPTVTAPNYFNGFAGDCGGYGCVLQGNAEKTVVAMFTATPESHPNWTGDSSVHPSKVGELNCMECHGVALQGVGIAPNCYGCHATDGSGGPVQQQAATAQEKCTECHPQDIGTADHQATYNKFLDGSANGGTVLTGSISSLSATALTGPDAGLFKLTVKFSLAKSGTALTSAAYTALGQKRLSFTKYDSAKNDFFAVTYVDPADGKTKSVSFGTPTLGTDGLFAASAAKAPFDPKAVGAPTTFLYFYFSDVAVIPPEGHYFLPDNTVSMAQIFPAGATIGYVSTANAAGCENCHGAPYSKHGYRQANVAGLPSMVACKACHYDDRVGTDFDWQVLANEPETLAACTANGTASASWTTEPCLTTANKYKYIANVMNDTHMSHGMEFPYPQSMANCATCHANASGVLADVNKDANFHGLVCKSCHATTATFDTAKRAPSFAGPVLGPPLSHHDFDWDTGKIVENRDPITGAPDLATELDCVACHDDNVDVTAFGGTNTPGDGVGPFMFGQQVPLFKDIHDGFNDVIYADNAGARYTSTITTTLNSASYAADKITFNFTVNGAAGAKPTVVVSLYGYDTKDFIVGGHGSAADGKRNLEWAEGASGNSPRLTVTKQADGSFTAVATLTDFLAKYNDAAGANKYGTAITRAELGMLPQVGKNPALAPDNNPTTGTPAVTNPNYNPYIAVKGLTKTFDLATGLVDDVDAYGRDIVSADKCNKCHDALAVEFHSPNYGSAGVVACRLCHIVGSGGSHLEMQSRSIDSYIHAIHSFQAFDVNSIDFNDPVQDMEYNHHTSFTYPRFTTLSCESCHNAGKYDMPAQNRSLPSILSASSTVNKARDIGGVSTVVVGPAGRACGGCHRAMAIKTDDATRLAQYDQHTATFGIRQGTDATTPKIADVLDKVIAQLKAIGVLP